MKYGYTAHTSYAWKYQSPDYPFVKNIKSSTVELQPTSMRLRALRSIDWARRAAYLWVSIHMHGFLLIIRVCIHIHLKLDKISIHISDNPFECNLNIHTSLFLVVFSISHWETTVGQVLIQKNKTKFLGYFYAQLVKWTYL